MGEPRERQAVVAWVDRQVRSKPGCKFVLTSRPQSYLEATLQGADGAEVQPFTAGQVQTFIYCWYLANEIKSPGDRLNASVRDRARRDAEDLIR